MANTLVQVRIDDNLKAEATALYAALGLDLPTAIRMFIKRSVMVGGVPFSMTLPTEIYKAVNAVSALSRASESAKQNGVSEMSLEEINAEIDATRSSRA